MQKAQEKTSVNRPWHSSLCVGTRRDMCRIQHVLIALQVCKASRTVKKQGTVLSVARKEPRSRSFSRTRLTKSFTFKKKWIQKRGTGRELVENIFRGTEEKPSKHEFFFFSPMHIACNYFKECVLQIFH